MAWCLAARRSIPFGSAQDRGVRAGGARELGPDITY